MGLLRDVVAEFADPPDGPLARLEEYGSYLLAGNTVARLMGPRDWDGLFPHLLDCAAAASFVPQDARTILDWGSGGGLPGLVWAILFPEKRILLAERNGKKAGFLEEAAVRLELTNVEVLHGQAEEELKHEERPDIMVARAVEPLPKLLKRIRRNREELLRWNQEEGTDDASLVNGRRLTNIGTFRAYLDCWLRQQPATHKDMTFLVRHLAPDEFGLPVQIYLFSSEQRWAQYEAILADIFDHILAVLPEFDLRVYQRPTGADFRGDSILESDKKL